MSTQTQRVIDTLTNSGFPLTQARIAELTGDPAPSVRRVVQTLEKSGTVEQYGWDGARPEFRIKPVEASI